MPKSRENFSIKIVMHECFGGGISVERKKKKHKGQSTSYKTFRGCVWWVSITKIGFVYNWSLGSNYLFIFYRFTTPNNEKNQ